MIGHWIESNFTIDLGLVGRIIYKNIDVDNIETILCSIHISVIEPVLPVDHCIS